MKKIRLFTPGPVSVPSDVLLAQAKPVIHHRTKDFQAILSSVAKRAQYLFQTQQQVFILAASGTGGMEAAIATFVPPGKKALVVRSGKFSERWAEVCTAYGIPTVCYDVEWGLGGDPKVIADYLAKDAEIGAVIVTHSETSTASAIDLEAVAKVVKPTPAILLVDGITSVGALPVKFDEWGVDAMCVGSQKACMLPPGLAFVATSEKAWKIAAASKPRNLYLDLRRYKKSWDKEQDTPFTPAISMIVAAETSLAMIEKDTMEKVWKRTSLLAKATREAAIAMGLKVYSRQPSDSVTAIWYPEGVDDKNFRKFLRENFGLWVAGGQGNLEGKVFRISHMGELDAIDAVACISAVEYALKGCGYPVKLGAGVAKAHEILAAWQ